MRTGRLINIRPKYPERGYSEFSESVIEIAIDTGLRTGQATIVTLTVNEAIMHLADFMTAIYIVHKARQERENRT